MSTKTITIDLEAYALLAARKRRGQSFSKVIKEHLGPAKTARAVLEALPEAARKLSVGALDDCEAELRRGRKDRARASKL